MAALNSLYPDILPYVPGCPDPLVDQEVRRAAIEFFRRTRAWVEWLDDVTTISGTRQYAITLPADSEVFRIQKATLDGDPLTLEIWRTQDADPATVAGANPALVSRDRRTMVLMTNPATGQKVKAQAVLMPSITATTLPDALYAQHSDAIAEGAKHRLMRMPGPLRKPLEAEEARQRFEVAIAAVSHDAWRGHTDKTPRASMKWC